MEKQNSPSRLYKETANFFEEVKVWLPENERSQFEKLLLNPTLEIIEEIIDDSRPPVFFLVGRSGHGKSSLINTLAGKHISQVNPIKPQTRDTEAYDIHFEEQGLTWTVIDSRGIFESSRPVGAEDDGSLEKLIEQFTNDIKVYKPDIVFHVISAPEARTLSEDFSAIEEIKENVKSKLGYEPPFMAVLNKCDSLGKWPTHWPPEEFADKEELIQGSLDYMAEELLQTNDADRRKNSEGRTRAVIFPRGKKYSAIIPVSCIADEPWNIDTLSDVISEFLPREANTQFIMSQNRKKQLLEASRQVISHFSSIAAKIKGHPNLFMRLLGYVNPIIKMINPGLFLFNVVPFWPLVISLVALIGALSGKKTMDSRGSRLSLGHDDLIGAGISINIANEYFAALGIQGQARTTEQIHQVMWELFSHGEGGPLGRTAENAVYSIGYSAQAFFFNDEIIPPDRVLLF